MLTLCPSWQEDPKSTILMADLLGLHSSMFSGFRSQWMIDSSGVARNNSAVDKTPTCVNNIMQTEDTYSLNKCTSSALNLHLLHISRIITSVYISISKCIQTPASLHMNN